MALQRKLFLVEPKISEMGSPYFMHARENRALCGNARQRPCANSSLLLQGGLRYLFAGGQNFGYPPGRTAIALERSCRNLLRGDVQHGMLRYIALCG
jgi:hypothetical protein